MEDLASRGNFEWSDKSKRSEMEIEFRDHLVKDLLQSVRVIMWLLLWLTHTQFTGHFDIEDNFLLSFLDAIASINGGYGSQ